MQKIQCLGLVLGLCCLATTASAKVRVGLVLDKGGKDDKSFNAAAYLGATEAEKKLGSDKVELKVFESSDDTMLDPSLRTFAQRGYDLILGIGFVQAEAVKTVAKDFPKTHFVVVDSEVDLPNVRSVLFKEHEGSYLVGAIAAMTTKQKAVGFIGGMDIPLIRRFEMGYRAGVVGTKPGMIVISNFVGSTSDGWKNPGKGKELALSQFHKNVDVIFAAAGASGLGVFDAAEEMKKLVIGVDSNQDWLKPGFVLTSMVKRVDLAVLDAIESETQGKFQPGTVSLGLKEGAIDFTIDKDNRALLSPAVEKEANRLKKAILSGKITVPDFYLTNHKSSKGA